MPGASATRIVDELFVIPAGKQFLLYAPLVRGRALVNAAAVELLRRFRAGRPDELLGCAELRAQLLASGILEEGEAPSLRPPAGGAFDPRGLTLLLTERCSLRCLYCYADGGRGTRTMRWGLARAALDWCFDHTLQAGRRRFVLNLHGGGEVTSAFPLVRRCVEHARARAREVGIEVSIEAGLNGAMAPAAREWIARNLDRATVSLDGPPEIQDRQRPRADGAGSFESVAATLRRFDEVGFPYGLRATVTGESVGSFADSAAYLARTFGTRSVQAEPVFLVGRALASGVAPVDPAEFVAQFRRARPRVRALGKELRYSGARPGTLTSAFCQGAGNSVAVTPDGSVTSCWEVTDPGDARASLFHYGAFDEVTGHLVIDAERLARLQRLTVDHKPHCRDCFCKWHCAGDCPAKVALDGDAWDPSGNPRCVVNRELTRDLLLDQLHPIAAGGEPP